MANYQTYKKLQGDQAVIPDSLGPGQVSGLSTGIQCRSFYFNCCNQNPCNGGCCYNWTVPSKVATIQFEIISGGGSGAPARCCGGGPGTSAGGGGYATKTVYANCGHFTPGSTSYTICAGSSSRCSCCGCCNGRTGCGFYGCPSFVQGGGLGTFCMQGGSYAAKRCTNSCYTCFKQAQRTHCYNGCSASWPDSQDTSSGMNNENEFYICGVSGGELKHVNCHSGAWSVASTPPGPWSANRNFGTNRCAYGNARGCCSAQSIWPGGGGHSGSTQGGQCWGDHGNGGLVVVTSWS